MRRQIVAGNWKMNKNLDEAIDLAKSIKEGVDVSNVEVIIAPPATYLYPIKNVLSGASIKLSAQNAHSEISGAYTGELSAEMIKSVGAEYVILGHSERREIFKESNELVAKKVSLALESGLKAIFCCGEPLNIREAGEHKTFVAKQVEDCLFHLSPEKLESVIIAYEPIWAIGTGKTASPEQAQEIHAEIRRAIADKYGAEIAGNVSVLYGGSCKPGNAKELFVQPDIDGGLIGGASLVAEDFISIVNSFQ